MKLVNPNCYKIRMFLKHGDDITVTIDNYRGKDIIRGKIFIPDFDLTENVWICSNSNILDGALIPTIYNGENLNINLGYKHSWCIREIPDCELTIETKRNTQIKNWGNRKLRKILMEKNII